MKKVLYQSLPNSVNTGWRGAVALLGLTRRDSKWYGAVPFCSSTFIQLLSSFSCPDEDCSTLLLELLLLFSSALFSVFPDHQGDVTGRINIRTCLRAMADIDQLSIESRLSCFMSYFWVLYVRSMILSIWKEWEKNHEWMTGKAYCKQKVFNTINSFHCRCLLVWPTFCDLVAL